MTYLFRRIKSDPVLQRWIAFAAAVVVAFYWAMSGMANARDLGQWENTNPAIGKWFRSLMQPDNPGIPCCGEADAYWADAALTENGQLVAVITDDRPDAPLRRHHVPVGTKIVVPPNKIKWDKGNPTGHIVIFLSNDNYPFCYVQNGGV
jgi:hypothetical protein